jgi:hypothetical protein
MPLHFSIDDGNVWVHHSGQDKGGDLVRKQADERPRRSWLFDIFESGRFLLL